MAGIRVFSFGEDTRARIVNLKIRFHLSEELPQIMELNDLVNSFSICPF